MSVCWQAHHDDAYKFSRYNVSIILSVYSVCYIHVLTMMLYLSKQINPLFSRLLPLHSELCAAFMHMHVPWVVGVVWKRLTAGWADLWSDLIDFCSTQLCLRISVRLSFPRLEAQEILLQRILQTDSVSLSHPASLAGEESGCRGSEVNRFWLPGWLYLPAGSDVTDCSFTTYRHTYILYVHTQKHLKSQHLITALMVWGRRGEKSSLSGSA